MLQILVALQTVAIKCEEGPNQFTESIAEVTSSLNSSVNSQLQKTRQEMLRVMSTECQTVLDDKVQFLILSNVQNEISFALSTRTCLFLRIYYNVQNGGGALETGARSRGELDTSEISSLVDKHLVSEIQSLISSRNFNVAFYIAESTIDKIVEMLHSKYDQLKALVSLITSAGGGRKGLHSSAILLMQSNDNDYVCGSCGTPLSTPHCRVPQLSQTQSPLTTVDSDLSLLLPYVYTTANPL